MSNRLSNDGILAEVVQDSKKWSPDLLCPRHELIEQIYRAVLEARMWSIRSIQRQRS
jgi:hypothetical protein